MLTIAHRGTVPSLHAVGRGQRERGSYHFSRRAKSIATLYPDSHTGCVRKISVSVQRGRSGQGGRAQFETHQVELAEKASVLDALFALQRGPCPDLAFRFSCRVGMCGSCAMVVNGREQLTCSTLVNTIGTKLRIEPLRNLPVVRDLAVNYRPFFEAYKRTMPQFVPRDGLEDFYPIPRDSREGKSLDRQPQCIDCGACYSACTLVNLKPGYLGPMALHRA